MMHADLASSGKSRARVEYEDLVRSTEPTLRAMLRFLEIDNVDSNRIDCAKQLSDDPSVKENQETKCNRADGQLHAGPGLRPVAPDLGQRAGEVAAGHDGVPPSPRVCANEPSRAGTSFFCDLEDVSAMSEGRGDNCGGNLASSDRWCGLVLRHATSSSSRCTGDLEWSMCEAPSPKPRETALDRASETGGRAARRAQRENPPRGPGWPNNSAPRPPQRRRKDEERSGGRGASKNSLVSRAVAPWTIRLERAPEREFLELHYSGVSRRSVFKSHLAGRVCMTYRGARHIHGHVYAIRIPSMSIR